MPALHCALNLRVFFREGSVERSRPSNSFALVFEPCAQISDIVKSEHIRSLRSDLIELSGAIWSYAQRA